jgi:putative nucleotidyltransferase with HDIG domain
MLSNVADPGVLVIGVLAVLFTGLSIYVSRVYLPRKMKKAYIKSITVLAAAVETKDSGTVGHAQCVAELAMNLARMLGVDGAELERIHYAALLMDIGKANVPQSLLIKRDRLTEREWETIKSHSTRGAEMVAAVPFLAHLADYIRHHHEYWDGSGYPDGLKGEEIPLASRILGVASDYDAMVSERPYHPKPFTEAEALEEIRKGIGVKYDPSVAGLFLEMMAANYPLAAAA